MDGNNPQVTVFIILLLFLLLNPDQQRSPYYTQSESEKLEVERAQDFDTLANSTYGQLTSSGLNLTGIRLEDGYQINLVLEAQRLSRLQYKQNWLGVDAFAPVYHDVDGEVDGDFKRVNITLEEERKINLTEIDPSTEYFSSVYDRNITEATGKLTFVLKDTERASKFLPREVKSVLTIYTNSSSRDGWNANLRGVHFPSGGLVLTTSSRKFDALPALPHFTLSKEEFIRATPIVNNTVTEIWKQIDQSDDAPDVAAPKCELIAWLQPKPLSGSRMYIDRIEDELNNPDGAPIGELPPLAYSAVVFSPDCGYMLTADLLLGPKREAYWGLARRLIVAFIMVIVLQIILLKRQMERSANLSTRSRISFKTIGIAALSDGLILLGIYAVQVAESSILLLASVAAFLCTIQVAFLEVKFIFDIWTVQVGDPENAERERRRRTAATSLATVTNNPTTNVDTASTNTTIAPQPSIAITSPTSTNTAAPPGIVSIPISRSPTSQPPTTSEDGLPLPVTAPRPNSDQPIILPSDQDTTTTGLAEIPPRASFSSLYVQFYFTLMNLLLVTIWATTWSTPLRRFYFNTLTLLFLSLWIPQIHRNTMRNCRKALSWEYVIGTSTLRALPMLYWYISPRNLLDISPSPRTALFLTSWLSFQILILLSQQFFGARWFVRDAWCPPAYDYHPILYDDLEAGGLPIGEVTSASEGKTKVNHTNTSDGDSNGSISAREQEKESEMLLQTLSSVGGGIVKTRKIFDCAICMNEIDVPVISKDERKSAAWLEQRNYMVTPCRHIFHSECLEGWMDFRLVCPVCREALPPL